MIVDTHCHLYMQAFDADREEVIARAHLAGVKHMVNVGVDAKSNEECRLMAAQHENMRHTAGFHPHSAHEFTEEFFLEFKKFIRQSRPSAIGEVGLDYFKSQADPVAQKRVFARMVALALEEDLPLVVHSREAFQDTVEILKTEGHGRIHGVMHCFSYDLESAHALYDMGFMTSFTCNVTYKNAAGLAEVAAKAPLDRIMLETDSPYLSPQSHRGKRNEPAHLTHLVAFLAQKRGVSVEELERTTTRSALDFFGFPTHG